MIAACLIPATVATNGKSSVKIFVSLSPRWERASVLRARFSVWARTKLRAFSVLAFWTRAKLMMPAKVSATAKMMTKERVILVPMLRKAPRLTGRGASVAAVADTPDRFEGERIAKLAP